jgi:hypothetical protein
MADYHGKISKLSPYIFTLFFVVLLFPSFFYLIPSEGLDPSYDIAIHLAYTYHLVFGKDFVFTFGPLGFLNSRLPIGVNMIVYLLFDIYFLVTLFFVLRDIVLRHFRFSVLVFIFLCISIAPHDALFQRLFLFYLFFLFAFIRQPGKMGYFLQAAFLSILCFYYKVNLGLIAVSLFLLALIYSAIQRKITFKNGMTRLVGYLVCILVIAWVLHVNIKGYITGSLALIDAYNDAMSMSLGTEYRVFVFAAMLIQLIIFSMGLSLLILSIRKKELVKNADSLFIYAVTVFCAFVIFKSAFVRADNSHISLFFNIAAPLTGLLYLNVGVDPQKKWPAIACWISLIVSGWGIHSLPGSQRPYSSLAAGPVMSRFNDIGRYFSQIQSYEQVSEQEAKRVSGRNALKEIIGDHSADVLPSEVSTIYFNGLKYDPRPVVQSYSAYNTYLDSLNEQKYLSADAPDYILFSLASIDDRLPFFDESRTKLAILSRYTVVGSVNGVLLLRKKISPNDLVKSSKETIIDTRLGQDVLLPKSDGLEFARIFVNYSLYGRLNRFLYQPPSLRITLTLEDGESMEYQGITTLLADGLIINRYVDTKQDFQLLMQSDARVGYPIKKIRIDGAGGNRGFVDAFQIRINYYSFPAKPEAERYKDSLGLSGLIGELNESRPYPVNANSYKRDSFQQRIESIKSYSPLIRIEGWAFREKADNENILIKAAFLSADSLYLLPSSPQYRRDLVSYFKRKDISGGGFKAVVSKSQLKSGKYRLRLIIEDTVRKKSWIGNTDQEIMIP